MAELAAQVHPWASELAQSLRIPGFVDVHAHFMPESVMVKVWQVFDNADQVYGVPWPVQYRSDAGLRLEVLRSFGVVAFTSMIYAHKPGMAAWLNDWSCQFATQIPDVLHTATFFPEPGVGDYVRRAIEQGTRVFKIHLQVGDFDPRDPLLDEAWDLVSQAQIPTVIHCGSGPLPGRFTGPGPVSDVLRRHPALSLIIAHMGSPEYEDFLSLTESHDHVRLDTTMAFTDFMEGLAPFPRGLVPRLAEAGLRGDVLFGSDFPNIPYSYFDAVDALSRFDLGDEWMGRVLYRAAADLFQLGDRLG